MQDPIDSTEPLDDRPSPEPPDAPSIAPRQSFFRGVPWKWRDLLIGLAPLLLIGVAPSGLLADSHWNWIFSPLLAQAWMLCFPLWIAHRRTAGWPSLPRPREILVESPFPLLIVAAGVALLALAFVALVYLSGRPARSLIRLDPRVGSLDAIEYLRFLFMVLLVAPVAEEVFFRGLIYNALRQRLHWVVAILLQAAAFSFLHHFGVAGSTFIAVGGLVIGLVYERRKTLLAPVLLHAFVNAVVMTFIAWGILSGAVAPRLGVTGDRHENGCRITWVAPGSAADSAGLKVGDVITSLDGEPITDLPSLTGAVQSKEVGQKVVVEFLRGRELRRVDAILKRR
jgi:membrane protease YdiL (CAAX protease family)